MVADTKKAQTLINAAAEEAETIKLAAARLAGLRAIYNSANVDPTGTALEGNVAAVSNWISSVQSVAAAAVANALIAAKVPTHRGRAL